MQPLSRVLDRVDTLLEDDLLRWMLEALPGKPAPMRQSPVTACAVDASLPQQKGQQLLTLATQVVRRRLPRPDEIAHRFVHGVGHPDPRQLACPMQPRQRHRIPPIGLDPLAGPPRDKGRGHHGASVAERLHLTVEPVTGRSGFETDMQPAVSTRKLLERPLDRRPAVFNLAEKPHLPPPAALGDSHRVLPLRHVKCDKDFAILSHGPPSVHEARLGCPSNPRFYCTKGRATGFTPGT